MKKILVVLLLCFGLNSFSQTNVPDVSLTALNGKSVRLKNEINKDKVTIISFWATWCIPCINELNAISEVYEQWQKDANVELIAVSIDDARTQKRVKPLVNGKGWKYKVFIDKNQELKRMLNISSVPYLIVVKNGKIIYNHSGYSAGSENELYDVIKNTEHKSSALDNLSVGFESNMQYYLNDDKTGKFKEKHRFRSNNYLKVDYTLGKFYAGIQVEGYEPEALLNYSPNLDETNIALYTVGYRTDKLDLTAGYFYEQFGSGLILRCWEDRQLGINNALRGGRVKYSPTPNMHFTALYGKQRYGFDVSKGDIMGFNTDIQLSDMLNLNDITFGLGASYVGRTQSTVGDMDYDKLTNAFSARANISKGSFYASAEYVNKSKDAVFMFNQVQNIKSGNALLFNTGYAKEGVGIAATFRRMENMSFFSNREAWGNQYNENIINYVPALTKQHDYLLTNIYVYQAQGTFSFQDPTLMKVGEIGGQIDFYYKWKKGTALGGKYGTKIAVNASYWAGLEGTYDYDKFDYDTDFFGFGEKYFSDISVEIRKKWSEEWSSILYYVNQSYNMRYIEEKYGKINADILVAEATYKMPKGKSLRFEAQHLWTDDDKKNWIGGTCEFYLNSKLSFYVNDIYNYGNDEEDKQIHYYNVGCVYTSGKQRFSLNYGRQRGGLLCVGGVCRVVPESTGISASVVLSF